MLEDAKAIMADRERAREKKVRALRRRVKRWDFVVGPQAAEFAEAARQLKLKVLRFEDDPPTIEGWQVSISPATLSPDPKHRQPNLFSQRADLIVVGTDGSWGWFVNAKRGFPERKVITRVNSSDALKHENAQWSDALTDDDLAAVLRPEFVKRLTNDWYPAW